jgi:CRISPR/Cas system CMR-associated protein Cmr5 small subunit
MPTTTLDAGLRATIAFYRQHFAQYVPAADRVGAL